MLPVGQKDLAVPQIQMHPGRLLTLARRSIQESRGHQEARLVPGRRSALPDPSRPVGPMDPAVPLAPN